MNRNFKRVLAGLAALTLCVGVVPSSTPSVVSNMAVVASAADLTDYTQIGDSDAYYKIDGDTLYVDGFEKNTEVPMRAFDSYNGIKLPETVTKVVIEENISSVGSYAFSYC